ncbi:MULTISPECIES: ATP-binding protein [unclassified Rhizobium]|uniref:ATP-binding protein n=1 Tax=unclassified Rhizobium TaxID=2613769 RepID=UPI001ADB6865|nr:MULTISPECIES: winged helix-turn-helix domain-containing protein [unclassified Rhizobium]MBO9127970.1 helix-turn-helix transcriptional regulator [Rhizobium sp. 16-488-2b]MBO9178547.1 helix-turn-helix transcriptional regulator [Rhizobium sp. 16-488-2a]
MTILRFADFEMDVPARSLKRSGRDVRIGSRAFDLLAALASNQGEILSKAQLMEVAWPETHVEESSLRVNIVSLRKALDGGNPYSLIENVAGRGYTFTTPVTKLDDNRTAGSAIQASRVASLPHTCARLVGRGTLVSKWADEIGAGITTIVGPGGIGKTVVALQMARLLQDTYDSIQFLDLADMATTASTPFASALQAENLTPATLQLAVESFGDKSSLLVLDGCDCFVDRVALIAESIADRLPDLAILTTSREPLGIIGENVLHLPGLAVPAPREQIDDVAAFSAVELFAERVSMVAEEYAIDGPRGIELAAEVVRKTDGNPLAIELAASRVADLGLENLVISLDRPLRTLRRGNRTSHPRQQTLRANIDWSYNLLDKNMKSLLVSLSVFDANFTKDFARANFSPKFPRSDFEDAFDGLVVKSLIAAQHRDGTYALPRLIREYAIEKHAQFTTATFPLSLETDRVDRSDHRLPQAHQFLATHNGQRALAQTDNAA